MNKILATKSPARILELEFRQGLYQAAVERTRHEQASECQIMAVPMSIVLTPSISLLSLSISLYLYVSLSLPLAPSLPPSLSLPLALALNSKVFYN